MTTINACAVHVLPEPWGAKHSQTANNRAGLRAIATPPADPEHRHAEAPPAQKSKTGEEPSALLGLFHSSAFEKQYQADSTVLLHGDPTDSVFLITSGTVRCCTIDAEGSRQIFRFAKKGEFIGIADIETWHFTAEAVDHVTLKVIPKDLLERELTTNVELRQEFRILMSRLLASREQQLLAIIHRKATDRLYHFLCDFASTRRGTRDGTVALPMCRRDIADHLGLSVETVSRAFTDLKHKGQIELLTAEKYRLICVPRRQNG